MEKSLTQTQSEKLKEIEKLESQVTFRNYELENENNNILELMDFEDTTPLH